MQFLDYSMVPEKQVLCTFKNAAWRGVFWATIILAFVTAYTAIPKGEATNPIFIIVPGIATLLSGLVMVGRLRENLNRRNWLVKATNDGLYLNLQPNTAAPLVPQAPEVLFLPRPVIVSISRRHELRTLPDRHGHYKTLLSYFDLELADPVPEALLVALAQIRRNPRLRHGLGIRRDAVGAIRVQDRHTIRLLWDWMSPRELRAAQWFAGQYPSEPFKQVEEPGWEKLTPEQQATYIDTLWEWGYVQDASHLSSMTRKVSQRKAILDLAERLG